MTMDLYGHLVDDNLWQAARIVGGRFFALAGTAIGFRGGR
jgi:hypothetical protein